jgi:hypothetical protein
MVPIVALWLPILLAAVLVFVVSSIIHMLLPYHRSDLRGVPDQDRVMEALRPFPIPPGDYVLPHASSMKESGTPEFVEKMRQGPVMLMTVLPNGPISMGSSLVQWFLYSVLIGIFVAYVGGRTLPPGTEYMKVFQITSCVAFMGYALALLHTSIWFKRKWSTTLKSVFDGILYGLVTAGAFSWLWPG